MAHAGLHPLRFELPGLYDYTRSGDVEALNECYPSVTEEASVQRQAKLGDTVASFK